MRIVLVIKKTNNQSGQSGKNRLTAAFCRESLSILFGVRAVLKATTSAVFIATYAGFNRDVQCISFIFHIKSIQLNYNFNTHLKTKQQPIKVNLISVGPE